MKGRPILVAVIGYIIGILWGIYFNLNIALFYFFIIAIYYIYKKIIFYKNVKNKKKIQIFSIKRYFRYIKLIIKPSVIFILIIFSIFSNIIITIKEKKYEKIYQKEEYISLVGIIEDEAQEKEYYYQYQVKVLKSDTIKELEKEHLYIQIKKDKFQEFQYGDKIQIQGKYNKPKQQSNYGGFDYKEYLKTKKIVGIVETKKIKILKCKSKITFIGLSKTLSRNIKKNIDKVFEKETASIIKGLLLGDVSDIDENIKEDFRTSNMSHILAISGMHINYIVLGITFFLNKIMGKRKTKIIIILFLIVYMFLTGCTPSVVRAVIIGIINLCSGFLYRKSDIWTSLSISLFISLLDNPYSIKNIGLQLSYLGTIGILVFNKFFHSILNSISFKDEKIKKPKTKLRKKTEEILAVSLSAQIVILPIILYNFNIFDSYFILSNFLVSIIIGPIIILGFMCVLLSFISVSIEKPLSIILQIGIKILIQISKLSNLPLSKIYVPTLDFKLIVVFWILVVIIKNIYFMYKNYNINTSQRRFRNLVALIKLKIRLKKNKCTVFLIIFIIIVFLFRLLPKDLRIYFIDVGQGDCTFIITPQNHTILIDGGGNEVSQFDVGKNVVLPYLLDRGYTSLDYVIISHFDSDHVRSEFCIC